MGQLLVICVACATMAGDTAIAPVHRLKEGLLVEDDLLPGLQRRQFTPSTLTLREAFLIFLRFLGHRLQCLIVGAGCQLVVVSRRSASAPPRQLPRAQRTQSVLEPKEPKGATAGLPPGTRPKFSTIYPFRSSVSPVYHETVL